MTFDTTANKVVLSYKVGVANTGNALVGTVSGTSISFGSEATFESGDPDICDGDSSYIVSKMPPNES